MSATQIIVKFTVEHGEEGCGEPWSTWSLTAAALLMLAERFEDDGLRVRAIAATEVDW